MFGNRLIATENLLFRCPFWSEGWCYADPDKNTSDFQGECNKPLECQYRQESISKMVEETNKVDK